MELTRHSDLSGFSAAAGAFLRAHEAEHNLILGLVAQLGSGRHAYAPPWYMATVAHRGQVVAAALRTPPHDLILSRLAEEAALPPLIEDALATWPAPGALLGVLGPTAAAAGFAAGWCARRGGAPSRLMAERIHELAGPPSPPLGVPGRCRPATAADRPLLLEWVQAFHRDALEPIPPERAAQQLDTGLPETEGRGFRVWEDGGRPVSMALFTGPTPRGMRVGGVYTPAALRGRGYASAVVAALSGELLARGRERVYLFTDVANPISNRIYHRIGYRPVGEVERWRL